MAIRDVALALARINAHTIINPETGCKIWTRARVKNYGVIQFEGKLRRVHRVAWEIANGPVPEGLELDHTCHTNSDCDRGPECPHRACCNPDHLEPVTHAVNVLRGTSPSAKHAVKTHCDKDHPLSGDNLYVIPSTGGRCCRICRDDNRKAWKAANQEAVRASRRAYREANRDAINASKRDWKARKRAEATVLTSERG